MGTLFTMVAANRSVRVLDRARRRTPLVFAICALGTALGTGVLAVPAQADRIGDARAEANRVWNQLEADGRRIDSLNEKLNGARVRLAETDARIRDNTIRLGVARSNVRRVRGELDASLLAAYRNPAPDPVAVVLQARSLGSVLEEISLLNRTNRRNAVLLGDVRSYKREVVTRQQDLASERTGRQGLVDDLASRRRAVRSLVAQNTARYAGLKGRIKRLIEARQHAEAAAAAHNAFVATQALAQSSTQTVATNDIGVGGAPASSIPLPAASDLGSAAVRFALGKLGVAYIWGAAGPDNFDCSGLVIWAYAQAGRAGLPHYTGDLWNSGTHVDSSQLAAGDLVFFGSDLGHVGIYIGGGQFVHAPHTGDVVKVSSLSGYYSANFAGAVRITG